MSMAATSEASTATMAQMMKATNPYLQREEEAVAAAVASGQGIESEMDMAAEATWLDGNKNEVHDIRGRKISLDFHWDLDSKADTGPKDACQFYEMTKKFRLIDKFHLPILYWILEKRWTAILNIPYSTIACSV